MLHINDVDHTQHKYGPRAPESYAAIKNADRLVGLVWEELKRLYPNQATFIIVSDHGFSEVRGRILCNVILKQAGLLGPRGDKEVARTRNRARRRCDGLYPR